MRRSRVPVWALLTAVAASLVAAPAGADEAGEPKPEAEVVLSLSDALDLANSRNLTLAQTRIEIDKARARVKQSWAAVTPVVTAGLGYTHLDHPDEIDTGAMMGGAPGAGGTIVTRKQDDLHGSLTAILSIIDGSSWATIEAAETGEDLSRLTVEQARDAVLYATAQAYYSAMMAKTLVDLRAEQIVSAEHHYDVATRKDAAGTGLRIDVLRARTDLETARRDLDAARLSLDTARDALGVLTGAGGLPLTESMEDLVGSSPGEGEIPPRGFSARKDLAVLRKTVDLQDDQATAAWMSLLPTLAATWQGTHQFTETGDMGDTDRTRWTLMLNLTVPIFNYYTYGDIAAKRAALRQASLQLEEKEQSAGREVRQARREYLNALGAIETAQLQVDLAREALDISTRAFEAGAGSSLDVTVARSTAAAAEVGLVTSRLQARLSLLALLQAAGEDPMTLR